MALDSSPVPEWKRKKIEYSIRVGCRLRQLKLLIRRLKMCNMISFIETAIQEGKFSKFVKW